MARRREARQETHRAETRGRDEQRSNQGPGERELRRKIDSERAAASRERVTIAKAGERYIDHLTALGRKRATLMDYESTLRVHLVSFFGARALDRIGARDVEALSQSRHAPAAPRRAS
jgi:hypothetical protein